MDIINLIIGSTVACALICVSMAVLAFSNWRFLKNLEKEAEDVHGYLAIGGDEDEPA